MSGQSDDKVLHRVFEKLLAFFSGPDQQATLLKRQLDPSFLKLLEDSGVESWLHLYELAPAVLFSRMMGELQDILNLKLPSNLTDAKELEKFLKAGEREFDKMFEYDRKEAEQVAKQRRLPYLLSLRCLQIQMVCIIRYFTHIQDLIEDAKQGNSEALIKLVKLDLTFLVAPYSRKTLVEMELWDQESLRIDLSKAVEPDPAFWDLSKARCDIAVILATCLGLHEWSYSEMAEFFLHHDLGPLTRKDALAKRIVRLGLFERKPYPKRRRNIDK